MDFKFDRLANACWKLQIRRRMVRWCCRWGGDHGRRPWPLSLDCLV